MDTETTPWIIITSHGEHSHPPVPTSKTPKSIVNGLIRVIRRINKPRTTLSKSIYLIRINNTYKFIDAFLTSNELKEFIAENHGRTIMDIHQSLANKDFLRHIIRKQQILMFPRGCLAIALALEQTKEQNQRTCVSNIYYLLNILLIKLVHPGIVPIIF